MENNITPQEYVMEESYLNLPTRLRRALDDEDIYLLVELYHPSNDDIFWHPERAMFRFAIADIKWQNVKYSGKIQNIPSLTSFVGKQFNQANIDLVNVQRGKDSPSFAVLNNIIRGFRVSIRVVFEGAEIKETRLAWWGRLNSVGKLTDEIVRLEFSQEIGDFSYEIATDKYQSGCVLQFGRGACLGNETFEEKSQLYQRAFNTFGQGGCNRTFGRCRQFNRIGTDSQERFFQGQKQVIKEGYFNRIEVVKKKFLFFFSYKKKNIIPVKYSVFNQDSNSDTTIPVAVGRCYIEGQYFTFADLGEQIHALAGFSKGGEYGIESFNNVQSKNPDFPIASFSQHLGTLGGTGTQFPDARFPESGYNSGLSYLGISFGGSQPDDTPDETPITSAVLKGVKVPVLNQNDWTFDNIWTHNPVWLTRFFMIGLFRYTVLSPKWFNEFGNARTANYCYTVIEDDTNSDIAVISSNEAVNLPFITRYGSASRYGGDYHRLYEIPQSSVNNLSSGNETSNLLPDIILDNGDIEWFPIGSSSLPQIQRTYLNFRYTLNGYIGETSSLTDFLYSLVFPTFRGFLHFNPYGQTEIQCLRPAPNGFLRQDTLVGKEKIPINNVSKLYRKGGYLLIGVGKPTAEIGIENGVEYVNGCANTEVETITTGSLDILSSDNFVTRQNRPSQIEIEFSGTSSAGEKITLNFTDVPPADTNQEPQFQDLTWDYVIRNANEDLAIIAKLFQTRLQASPSFNEFWTVEIPSDNPNKLVIKCQTGYLLLKKPLLNEHFEAEEVLRVVEVYENNKDELNPYGLKDNLIDASFNEDKERFHAVKAEYISAIQDFTPTELLPRIVWDSVEQERALNTLELDLRYVDNYRQAAFLVKSHRIDFVNGAFYGQITAPAKAMFHNEKDVIAVRYEALEGTTYLPFTVNDKKVNNNYQVDLSIKLYMSAAFDERVAQEETFIETTDTSSPDITILPPPILNSGDFSTTRTGDGLGDSPQSQKYESAVMELLPTRYHSKGRDKI